MAADPKMPDGLSRLPKQFQETNEGIERLAKVLSKNDAETKKQVSAILKTYHSEIKKVVKEQDKAQKEVAYYASELKKAGASDHEIAAYISKNVKLKSGEKELDETMKKMQESLQELVDDTKFKSDDDKKLADKQSKTLEKYFKEKKKTKAGKWASEKIEAAKTETGSALKDSLTKGLGVMFQTLLGPLRLIVDPILDMGGTKSIDLFEKILEKSNESKSSRDEEIVERYEDLNSTYEEKDDWDRDQKKSGKGKKKKGKEDDEDSFGMDDDEEMFHEESGGKGGIKGLMSKLIPILKVAAPFAVAAAGVAMMAGAAHLQKRDTADAKKYADRGEHGRAFETFLLGDRERITEENAASELGRTTGKATLAVGGAGLAVAGGAGIAAMGSTVATAGGIAAAGGLGAVGSAGLAAVGAALPPVLIAAAITAAAVAVAKGTQEAYELEYDKNAATIQRDLHRTLMDEEAPFLKRVGAGFKSEWIALTSTLAGGVRGATELIDVETERHFQRQLETLQKQADEGNENSARLYKLMSDKAFRDMSKKEKEKLMRSEGLYEEYLDVISETDSSMLDKLKTGAKFYQKVYGGMIDTAHENAKGVITARWEKAQLKNMDKELEDKETVDRLKNSDIYQKTLEETGGDKLKAMQEAFLDEKRQKAIARGDLDQNGMAVDMFDKLKLGFKSFTDISDEAIKQSTEFDTRRLQLLAEGKTAEEADQQAMEEQRQLLTTQMELRLKQTKEYKEAFDAALKQGKSLKEAEKEALDKVKKNKKYLKSFGETLGEGIRGLWEHAKEMFPGLAKAASGASAAFDWVKDKGTSVVNAVTGKSAKSPAVPIPEGVDSSDDVPSIEDGVVYKDGKVVRVSDDDNIIATKNEPFIGDRETNQAAAVPVMPAVKEFSDSNIISVLTQILTVLKEKEFSPVINEGSDAGMDFDGLRTAGGII